MKTFFLALVLATTTHFAFADNGNVFESSFENPKVVGRTPKARGGDPTKVDDAAKADDAADVDNKTKANDKTPHTWQNFDDQPTLKVGGITAGLTSEYSRTGDQCFYVQADHLGVPYQGVVIASETFPVTSATDYLVHIWGRNDAAAGFSSEGPQLYMKLEVDFFGDDGSTQVGDSEYLLQPLPGAKGHKPLFTSDKWSELTRRVTTPDDAKYMMVMWRWETVPDQEPVSGTMYFDDVTVEGDIPQPRTKPSPTPLPVNLSEPGAEETPAAEASPTESESPAPAATPSPTPVKSHKSKHKQQ